MTKDKVVRFTDLKDAMMSGSAGQIPVNVYQEDGAMAVLMNNTASSPTEPGGNEEAPDVQDPCKDLIELRLKKVWKEILLHISCQRDESGRIYNRNNLQRRSSIQYYGDKYEKLV